MNVVKTALACLATFCLAAPASALTVDQYGVVVFNQADVNAGGITPGDTPGFPASILVSGSYRLASPLTLSSLKNGIVISAPAVTLDLGGFKVSGAGVGRNGVFSDQIDTSISNGIIRGFTGNGIEATNAYLTVDLVRVTNNGLTGITSFPTGEFARITNSTFGGNGLYGVNCGTGCLVQGNISARNGGGIYLKRGGNAVNNVISNNDVGIVGNDSGFGNNTITENGQSVSGITANNPNYCNPACP